MPADRPLEAVASLGAGDAARRARARARRRSASDSREDLRAYDAALRLLDELERWERLVDEQPIARGRRRRARARAASGAQRPASRAASPSLDLAPRAHAPLRGRLRARPGGGQPSAPRRRLAVPRRRRARRGSADASQRADPVSRDRYLFYTACARPTRRLYLVREAATDEGSPREASPFWDEVASLFPPEEVARWTTPAPALRAHLAARGGADRARATARARVARARRRRPTPTALARANGWERRLDARARAALERPTRLRHPLVLEQLGARTTFNVTELERFADCSSAWFVDRVIDPQTIDAEVDAKLRGSVAHTAL